MKKRALATVAAAAALVVLLFLWDEPPPRERSQPEREAADARTPEDAPPPPVPATPTPATTERSILVRDLADGAPLPRFGVRLGSREIVSDDGGRLRVPAPEAPPLPSPDALVPADPGWVLVRASAAVAAAEGTLWAHRTFRVRGRVSGPGTPPLDPTRAMLEATWEGADEQPPWTRDWLSGHDVRLGHSFAVGAGADGTFDVELPRVPGFVMRARSRDWRPASAPLAIGGKTEIVEVDLVLAPAFRARGRIAGAKGRPLAGTPVHVYVAARGGASDAGDAGASVEWGDHTVREAWSTGQGDVRVRFGGLTDGQGRFELRIDIEGEGLLSVQRAGYATHHRALGYVRGDTPTLDLALEPGPGTRFRVLRKGAPAVETCLYLEDLEFPDFQPSFVLCTDADGSAPAEWLVAGHRYAVTLEGVPGGARELAWSAQAEVDVAALPEVRRP